MLFVNNISNRPLFLAELGKCESMGGKDCILHSSQKIYSKQWIHNPMLWYFDFTSTFGHSIFWDDCSKGLFLMSYYKEAQYSESFTRNICLVLHAQKLQRFVLVEARSSIWWAQVNLILILKEISIVLQKIIYFCWRQFKHLLENQIYISQSLKHFAFCTSMINFSSVI
jgi:hypothetical protein